MKTRTTAAITALALTASAGLAQTSTWNITTDGFWSTPTNWTPVNAPINATDNAIIPNTGTYNIRVSGNYSTNDITNNNPNATIELDFSRQHALFGDLHNQGVYLINLNAAAAQTTLIFNETAAVSGSGAITLNGFANRARLISDSGAVVTNGADHTIHGYGQMLGDFINNGTIDADVPFNTLNFLSGNVTNNAVIRATNDAILNLNFDDLIITQSPAGVVRADNATVTLTAPTIIGGTVEGINTGIVQIIGTPTFDNLDTNGEVTIDFSRTLNLAGTINNNGTITVNTTGSAATTDLDADDNVLLTGSGSVRLNGFANRARITTEGGGTITNDTNHTIEGYGQIVGSLTNNGLITANVTGQTLTLLTNNKTNNALISSDDGLVVINNITVDQTAGGSIAANSSNVDYSAATILGGTLEGPAGTHTVRFGSFFHAVTNNSDIEIEFSDSIGITGSITNNGSIVINPNAAAAQTDLRFDESGALNGTGTVTLNGFSTRAQLSVADPGITVTNAATHTIEGFGRITAPLVNNGLIVANIASQELDIAGVAVQNNSILRAENDALLELSEATNVTQAPGATIEADNARVQFSAAEITGGSLESTGTGSFTVVSGGAALTSVTNNALVNIDFGRKLALDTAHTNNNIINVNPINASALTDVELQQSMTINGTGEIRLLGVSTRSRITGLAGTETFTNGPDHTISGIGHIDIDIINNGTIAPGLSVGTLTSAADITMGATGTFDCEVNANNSADRLNLTSGTFTAAGTLDVSFIDAFDPANVWTATIVDAADVVGEFDTVNAPASPNPFFIFRVGYFSDEIRIGYVCEADFDLSGDLDFFDISTFLTLFSQGRPAADISGDGEYDFFDISAFLQLFTNGCE